MGCRQGKILIGTSGWHYKHWRGAFYPDDIRQTDYLSYYARYFDTAEINNSFYRLPSVETFRQWRDIVSKEFIFSVKASRYITHMKKLKDPDEPLSNFLKAAGLLGGKLGPVLFQCPPKWKVNPDRLASFVAILPEKHRFAMEFRHESWFDKRISDILAQQNVAWCIYELAGVISPKEVTADFVYIRLHGPAGAYEGSYNDKVLGRWADYIQSWAGQGRDVYCYFDNDQAGYAVKNASRLLEIVRKG